MSLIYEEEVSFIINSYKPGNTFKYISNFGMDSLKPEIKERYFLNMNM